MTPVDSRARLRVALVAGGLSQGGAEKQFVYMARALQERGVDVRCYSLTRGDFYETALKEIGVEPVWIGRFGAPPLRLLRLGRLLRAFAPHVVQAGHFFANLYAALGARACGAVSIGSIRNDGVFELRENKGWGPLLLRLPTTLIANSHAGAREARARGRAEEDITIVPNVIDLREFDAVETTVSLRLEPSRPLAIAVGRLVRQKRFDRLLAALALARRTAQDLDLVIVGDGPERGALEREAARLGLGDTAVRFLGRRADVPALLRQADFLVSSSDHEGFPNVLLEAMAARLPAVATEAGDVASILLPGVTGYVVPTDDVAQLADRMVAVARAAGTRRAMGQAARKRVELMYQGNTLADKMLAAYQGAASRLGSGPAWREPGLTPSTSRISAR